RFEDSIKQKQEIEGIRHKMPEAFLESLESLDPCAGIAFGVDRLVMLLAGAEDIDSVVAFPPETA
ncbi:MAG: amino acid--tRNA ligase-related protein, partial [Syntrophobacteraceae bacterium]